MNLPPVRAGLGATTPTTSSGLDPTTATALMWVVGIGTVLAVGYVLMLPDQAPPKSKRSVAQSGPGGWYGDALDRNGRRKVLGPFDSREQAKMAVDRLSGVKESGTWRDPSGQRARAMRANDREYDAVW